jgi:hypothetical protein
MAESIRLTGPGGYRSRISIGEGSDISRQTLLSRRSSKIRSGKRPAFILDLDETVWSTTPEAKAIEKDLIERIKPQKGFLTAKDWTPWRKEASNVKPISEMVDFVRGLQNAGIHPVIMTARDESNRKMVRTTLGDLGISTDNLMFRGLSQAAQDTPSDILKMGMMQDVSGEFNFLAMLDDSGANLRKAIQFGVPLGIQPEKAGFDSVEASVVRGLGISEEQGTRALSRAERAVKPIYRAGVRTGVQTPEMTSRVIEGFEQALKIMRSVR